ncbi:MAG: hypothetical protein HQK99_04260 [Nitrospirae bacterium]|nr:hypothetical protein [Nitrospirota bacterium]
MADRNPIKRSTPTPSAVLAVLFIILSGFAASAYAANYYVATNGSDSNPGTISQPFLTIQKCASTAASGSVCYIRAGTYRETVTPNSGITITSYNSEQVTIDGTDAVTGWKVYHGSIYSASARMSNIKYVICANGDNCTTVYDTNQLFVGQQMMTEARWPNGDDLFHINWATAQTGTTASKLVDSNLPNIDWTGARVHFWSGTDPWSSQTGTVTGSQSSQLAFTLDGATFPPMISPTAGGFYYVFGTLGALDTEN